MEINSALRVVRCDYHFTHLVLSPFLLNNKTFTEPHSDRKSTDVTAPLLQITYIVCIVSSCFLIIFLFYAIQSLTKYIPSKSVSEMKFDRR